MQNAKCENGSDSILHSAFCISLAAQPVGKLVDVGNGRRLHIVCMGSGIPTVVMESGAAEGFYSWWLVQQKLRDDVRTCSYDRAGFGWSDPTPSRSMSHSLQLDEPGLVANEIRRIRMPVALKETP